jgi:predicted dehydrogenase
MRIACIGCSGHWRLACTEIPGIADARLVAVAPGGPDEDIAPLRDLAAPLGATACSDHHALLRQHRPDLVVVDSRFDRHAAICCDVLAAGAMPLCEKPLATTGADLDRVRAASARARLPVGMLLTARYGGPMRAIRAAVQAGAIGRILGGSAQKSYPLGRRPAFFADRALVGGLIPWVGIHMIDAFAWTSGRGYAAVSAWHGNLAAPEYPGLEDVAGCLFQLAGGGVATMSFDYRRPPGSQPWGDDRLRLIGSDGILELLGGEAWLHDAQGRRRLPDDPAPHGPLAEALMVLAGGTGTVSSADAFAANAAALTARAAADSNRQLEIA